jgi:inositol 1,4,5-triphosphate receptor type 1
VDLFLQYEEGSRKVVGVREANVRSLVKSLLASHKWWASLNAKDQDLQETLDVRCLQLLRAMIHNEIKLEGSVEKVQNEIARNGAVLPVADMLSAANDDVVREALALLVALLHDGNKEAQRCFLSHFTSTREETFFDDVQTRVRRSIESREERRALERQLQRAAAARADLQATLNLSRKAKGDMQRVLAIESQETSVGGQSSTDFVSQKRVGKREGHDAKKARRA